MATSRENKTISQFKSALAGGGARPNLFEVEMATLPAGVTGWDADNFRYMCKACLLYTSPSPRDQRGSRMPSSA